MRGPYDRYVVSSVGAGSASTATVVSRQARAVRYLGGHLLAGATALLVLVLVVISAALSIVGVGLVIAGPVYAVVRRWADRQRVRTARFVGRPITSPYLTRPSARRSALRSHAANGGLARDLAAVTARALSGVPLGLFAIVLPLMSLGSALVPLYWWALADDDPTGTLFDVTSWWSAIASLVVGVAGLAVWMVAPIVAAADARFFGRLLSPGRAQELRLRAELERSRARSAVSAHSAELQRIERDLHDAAQNRLVAVAMFVGLAQRQVDTGRDDPAPSLARAQSAATEALAEVRRVIRGIYPPVLAEEGLVPALGMLVDQAHIPTRLHVDRAAPTPAAVDAALYFSIAEALTNVAKHSGATESDVQLSWAHGDGGPVVTAVVSDNGRGGADEAKGTGLSGIESRAQALGGRVDITSPAGGPTAIRMTLPCES